MNTAYRTSVTPLTGGTNTATPAQNIFAKPTAAVQSLVTIPNSAAQAGAVYKPLSLETIGWQLVIIIVLAAVILYAVFG